MTLISKRRRRWGGQYGDTHRGVRWYLFGWLPVWQHKEAIR